MNSNLEDNYFSFSIFPGAHFWTAGSMALETSVIGLAADTQMFITVPNPASVS